MAKNLKLPKNCGLIGSILIGKDIVWAAGEYRGLTVIDSKKKKFTRFNEIKNDRTYSTKDELIAYLTNEVLDKRKNVLKDVESDIVLAVKAKVEAVNDKCPIGLPGS